MGSTPIDLRVGDPSPASLALLAGLALHEAVSRYVVAGSQAMLKWPNDLMLDGGKLAGILLERQADRVVVGIGVNLAAAPEVEGRKTASLRVAGRSPDRDAFAEELAGSFATEVARWRGGGLAPILRRWQAAAHPPGTELEVHPPGEPAQVGTFAGLDEGGNLRLRVGESLRTIHAGDVSLVAAIQE